MRTLQLTEWQTTTQHLTDEELRQVLTASRFLTTSFEPSEDGVYRLAPGSRVGTIVLPDVRILIRPKVGLRNLFFLLGFRSSLATWSKELFPYLEDEDLLRAMAWLFEAEVARAMPRGVVRGYIGRSEALIAPRGRIDIGRQITSRRGAATPLECRFEEYTEDIELNQVLKAAHTTVLRLKGLDPVVMKRLRSWLRAFVEIEDVPFAAGDVPDLTFTHLNNHWEIAGRLAQLILRRESVADQEGATHGVAFTVDMNELFEKFVEEIVAEEARRAGWALVPQAHRMLSGMIRMRPDLVLQRGAVDYAVGDAKYKRLELAEMPHADIYQLLAYCVSLGLPRGVLIYATFEPLHREVVRHLGTELYVLGLDMSGTPNEVVAQARQGAGVLIDQARLAERNHVA